MLFVFECNNSEGNVCRFLFKAHSELDVAKHILSKIQKKDQEFLRPFSYGFTPYCCTQYKETYMSGNKETIKYFKGLNPEEFLDMLKSTHTHSGGDIHGYSIKQATDIIDLT